MYEVFTKLLNMNLTASILVLFVIFFRFVLKKAPKKYICILWAIVALRLICPFSISSEFSAYNMLHQNTVSTGQVEYFEYNGKTEKPELTFEVPALVNDSYAPDSMTIGTKTSGIYMPMVVYFWGLGVIVIGDENVSYTVSLNCKDNSISGTTTAAHYTDGSCTATFDKSKLFGHKGYCVVLSIDYHGDVRNVTLANDFYFDENGGCTWQVQ